MTKVERKKRILANHITAFIEDYGPEKVVQHSGYSYEAVRLWAQGAPPRVDGLLALHGLGLDLNLNDLLGGK